jgi:uncharacterized heparinase superfamily protein
MSERRPGVEAQPVLAFATAALNHVRRSVVQDWRGSPLYRSTLKGPPVTGVAITPHDYRPPDLENARALLTGRLNLADETLEIGQGGDPWDTASPSRPFAVALHRFAWLPGLIATADPHWAAYAREEALRLSLEWLSLFPPVQPFAWSAETLERRVYRWACALPNLSEIASDLERRRLLESLAGQARHLLRLEDGPVRAAERAAAAALAGSVLAGKAGESLLAAALPKLTRALRLVVLPDGGLKTRSPEQGMELLHDLLTLDDALHQRGVASPTELGRAIDRLTGATRFYALGDGRLGAFQGGEASDPATVSAAVAHEDASARVYGQAPHSGYHRLVGRTILALVDAAPPADGVWSATACAQPLAFEATCGGDRLIVNAGWSPDAQGPASLRLSEMGSTASIGDGSAGAPLTGFLAANLGPRLLGGATRVEARRHEDETGVWLDLCHNGWAATLGLLHERRLFLDARGDELRGEDCFLPATGAPTPRRRLDPFALHFHLAPEVKVSLARDKRSVLLRGPSNRGWWFRNDAPDVSLEPSVYFDKGAPRRTLQVVLKGQISLEGNARVRWKLTPVEPTDPAPMVAP